MKEHSQNHNKKKRIIEKYNSSSPFYDRRYKLLQEEKYEIVLNKYSLHGKIILDLGCGTGLFFKYIKNSILDKGAINGIYIALDISWNMLLEFKSKVINSNYNTYSPNLILSDMECLPFRNNIFYSIFSITSFQNLPYIEKGINELFRVSKKNTDFKISILKKKLELESLLQIIKPNIKNLKIIKKDNLEDIIIQGEIVKD